MGLTRPSYITGYDRLNADLAAVAAEAKALGARYLPMAGIPRKGELTDAQAGQVVKGIRVHLVSGRLLPGDQLPTVRQLGTELGANFNTIAAACRIVAVKGWLDSASESVATRGSAVDPLGLGRFVVSAGSARFP